MRFVLTAKEPGKSDFQERINFYCFHSRAFESQFRDSFKRASVGYTRFYLKERDKIHNFLARHFEITMFHYK